MPLVTNHRNAHEPLLPRTVYNTYAHIVHIVLLVDLVAVSSRSIYGKRKNTTLRCLLMIV
jgi:hypothetical protein